MISIWVYLKDSKGEWEMKTEYLSTVVPRVGDTISNKPYVRVIGVDFLFRQTDPIVSLFCEPMSGALGDDLL